MTLLPTSATDAELIAFIDCWAALLEREDYEAAFSFTDHIPEMGWTAALVRKVIKSYGEADANQSVTVDGIRTDIRQRKQVRRWPTNSRGYSGEIWYDLNIDGRVSDLTATFDLKSSDGGICVYLNDIHVM